MVTALTSTVPDVTSTAGNPSRCFPNRVLTAILVLLGLSAIATAQTTRTPVIDPKSLACVRSTVTSVMFSYNTDIPGTTKVLWGPNDNYRNVTPETDVSPPTRKHTVTIQVLPEHGGGNGFTWVFWPMSRGLTKGVPDPAKEGVLNGNAYSAKECSSQPVPAGPNDYSLQTYGPKLAVAGVPIYLNFSTAQLQGARDRTSGVLHTVSGQEKIPCSMMTWEPVQPLHLSQPRKFRRRGRHG